MIKWNSNLPPDEASSNPHCFLLLPTSRRQYHRRLHRLLRQFFPSTLSGKHIVVMLPHHSGIILFALLGCVDLLRSIDRARSPSFVLFRTMTTINFGRLLRRV